MFARFGQSAALYRKPRDLLSPARFRHRQGPRTTFDPRTFTLEGQIALVTGAGAGIGKGIAEIFAGAGASVVVRDLKQEAADEVAKGIVENGGRSVRVACNVTEEADLQAAVQAAVDGFGGLFS